MVLQIFEHDFSDTNNKLWLVQWYGDDAPSNTWENHATLKDVEAFHQYCATHTLNAFLPYEHPQFSASKPSTQRRMPDQYAIPQAPPDVLIGPMPEERKRGRPAKHRATETTVDWPRRSGSTDIPNGGGYKCGGGIRTRQQAVRMHMHRERRHRAQRARQSRERDQDRRNSERKRHSYTVEPMREITTMVVYLGVEVTEDA